MSVSRYVRTYVHVSTKSFSDFSEIWYVDRGRWLMHDSMPCDPIQGQGQGHGASKPLERSRPSVLHETSFYVSMYVSKRDFYTAFYNVCYTHL